MSKPLNSIDLQAANWVAEGRSEREIYTNFNKNRSWIQQLKRRDDFKKEVEEARKRLSQIVQKTIQTHKETEITDHLSRVESYRQRCENLGDRFLNLCERMLNLYEEKIALTEAADLSISRISGDVKNLAAVSEFGRGMLAQSIGVEQMMESFLKDLTPESSGEDE